MKTDQEITIQEILVYKIKADFWNGYFQISLVLSKTWTRNIPVGP